MGMQRLARSHATSPVDFFGGVNSDHLKPEDGSGICGASSDSILVAFVVGLIIVISGYPHTAVAQEMSDKPPIGSQIAVLGTNWVGRDNESNNLAQTISDLEAKARLSKLSGDVESAAKFYAESLQLRRSHPATDAVGKLATVVNLAVIYHHESWDNKAVPLYEEARDILESLYGRDNVMYGRSLLFLAQAQIGNENFAAARTNLTQCIVLFDKYLTPTNQFTAAAIEGMADMALAEGAYRQAESEYRHSAELLENTLGSDNPETARAWNNLGLLYLELCNYGKALPIFTNSLSTIKNSGDDQTVMKLLNSLASVYYELNQYEKAGQYMEHSLKLAGKVYGDESLLAAKFMNNLAEIYEAEGKYTQAAELLEHALKIEGGNSGQQSYAYAIGLGNLAGIYAQERNLAQAESLYRSAIFLCEKSFGTNYPDKASDCRRFETVLIDEGKLSEALLWEKRAQAAQMAEVTQVYSFTSERERFFYSAGHAPYDLAATLGDGEQVGGALLHFKCLLLDSLVEDVRLGRLANDPEVQRLYAECQQANRQLIKAELNAASATQVEFNHWHDEVGRWLAETDQLEKNLAETAGNDGGARKTFGLTWEEVQAALSDQSVLLEFSRYACYVGFDHWQDCYGVAVVKKHGKPEWLPLGTATLIDCQVSEYGKLMRESGPGDVHTLHELSASLLKPILEKLPSNITNLIISPDDQLNFLSFATLLDDRGEFVGEGYNISYVASGRDLVFGREASGQAGQLAVFANPQFVAPVSEPSAYTELAALPADLRNYDGLALSPLPNTSEEADFLKKHATDWHLTPKLYQGSSATERQVKALHSPYILHFATHGFFLPQAQTHHNRSLTIGDRLPVTLRNPMQRSGLALAGAQTTLDAWSRGEVPDPENDGILMADEVGLLDLQNTWLVTLSACDTGIGEARAGEGVMGLRRGFIQAGTQNLLMTLWPVSDRWTVQIMEDFYTRAMQTHDAPKALAEVQREYLKRLRTKKNTVLAARLAGPFVMNFQGRPGN